MTCLKKKLWALFLYKNTLCGQPADQPSQRVGLGASAGTCVKRCRSRGMSEGPPCLWGFGSSGFVQAMEFWKNYGILKRKFHIWKNYGILAKRSYLWKNYGIFVLVEKSACFHYVRTSKRSFNSLETRVSVISQALKTKEMEQFFKIHYTYKNTSILTILHENKI